MVELDTFAQISGGSLEGAVAPLGDLIGSLVAKLGIGPDKPVNLLNT